ncbi:hypothetical protein GA0111570_102396 [Raineyella antarctica]|uniref:Uncharacterized protein n=1 Tax=Raineyella antarctica TaxID=1577474 RepID=A0A1G6GFR7_9ACTN|nr:hypothetical protein [Raineyella antarctica]SDB80605.1 hypothetical protein GA0111570_102396 [Raineyella antarctica]
MKSLLAPTLLTVVLLAGCSGSPSTDGPEPAATARPAAAVTEFPGLAAATGEPDVPSLAQVHPRPGQAIRAAGPFDDRFQINGLAFTDGRVSGAVRITSDVSTLLELQVVAGFYDADGKLLGTSRFEHHTDESAGDTHTGAPSESEPFSIAVPTEAAAKAVSAAVAVPILVNE